MAEVTITGTFPDAGRASAAVRRLAAEGVVASLSGQREGGFMARFAVIVAACSIVGTAAGAVLGAALSYTLGPHGTEGLILLVVTWAIFAHLLIGLWAGYVLLSDRSERELSPGTATLTVQADEAIAPAIAERLRADGATDVSARGENDDRAGHRPVGRKKSWGTGSKSAISTCWPSATAWGPRPGRSTSGGQRTSSGRSTSAG